MKILSIVGARPQFIKVKPIIDELKKKKIGHILTHTGQHYDYGMSKVFFKDLEIPEPDYNLGVGSGSHSYQIGNMLIRLEEVLLKERPDIVLVYGDTNSTLAGALGAVKLHIPVGHIEAGMRSFNKKMPEEINRILTDHISDYLFCPTETAVKNLKNEGITKKTHLVGDVMYDTILDNVKIAEEKSNILQNLKLKSKEYHLTTVHRAENTDNKDNLRAIIESLQMLNLPVIFPMHPRTKEAISQYSNLTMEQFNNIVVIDPVSYLDMLVLEKNAKKILTDSGGIQKEAYWLEVPCITLREETEWGEIVQDGWNVLAGVDKKRIVELAENFTPDNKQRNIFGDGKSAEKIIEVVKINYNKPEPFIKNPVANS